VPLTRALERGVPREEGDRTLSREEKRDYLARDARFKLEAGASGKGQVLVLAADVLVEAVT
jgi:hypothetical protein